MVEFEFDLQPEFQNSVAIEDIGDCGIIATNDLGYQYCMGIRTYMGHTLITTCGPILPDIDILPDGFACTLAKVSFNPGTVEKKIRLWLNDPKKQIKFANAVTFEEAINEFRDITDYLYDLSEETI